MKKREKEEVLLELKKVKGWTLIPTKQYDEMKRKLDAYTDYCENAT